MDPTLKRAIWLLADSMLRSFKLDRKSMDQLEEAKNLVTNQFHEYVAGDGGDYDCQFLYKFGNYTDRCHDERSNHPRGLEPDGKT